MPGHFLTEVFNRVLQKFGYFKSNFNTLKRLLIAISLLVPCLSTFSQGNIEFIENKGQWNEKVRFKGNVSNGSLYIRDGGFTVVQHNAADFANLSHYLHEKGFDQGANKEGVPYKIRSHAFNVDFLGTSPDMEVVADKAIATYNNYFIGDDPSKWASNCRIFQGITFKNIYPNVDVRYYTDNGFLKYDIIVKPGGDVSKIKLRYDGVDKLSVKNKELVIATSIGELKESSPYTFQAGLEGRHEVDAKYVVKGNVLSFDIKDYDRNSTLVIDPVVVFCSFSGSTSDNWGFTATYGPDGSLFGGGIVFEPGGFPASPGAFQTGYQGGEVDISIIKLNPTGSNRVYATYIGGTAYEQPHSLIVDPAGNLILAGRTNSPNYPTINNGTLAGSTYDIVVTKLNASGTALIGSRRIGGSAEDGANITSTRNGTNSLQRNYGDDGRSEVNIDGGGNVYVASCAKSSDFPVTAGAFQPTFGGSQDGVVLKFNPNLSTLLFASYLGGSGNDAAYVLSLAPNGNIYVAGGTESSNSSFLPGTQSGTIGTNLSGSIDGYVAIVNNSGTAVVKSTYIGTSNIDQVFGIQFDLNGFPYVMGQTTGNWQIVNATYSNANGKQFIAKLQPDLSSYVYSTMFGSGASNPNISPIAFLVDRCENVYISGWGGYFVDNDYNTAGTAGLPVTADAIKSTTDGKDLYFFVLKKDATAQLFGSFFGETNGTIGSDHVDGGTSRFDANGVIYQAICGNCKLSNPVPVFPVTPGAWSTTNNANNGGGCQLTMLKIAMNLAGVDGAVQSSINGVPRDTSGCAPLTVDFSDSVQTATSYEWHFGDGSPMATTTTPNISHTYTTVGTFQVMMVAIDPNTCNVRDTSYLNIRVGDVQAVLDFDPVKLPPCEQFNYRFDNLSTAPASTPFTATSFIWDFGDGSPRVTTGPGPVFHTYSSPGSKIVKLILQDQRYCNAPDSMEFVLSVAQNVVAAFETPSQGCVPYTPVFENNTDAGETYLWDFGDGNTSTDFEPTHTYNTPGIYHVTLIASNPNTCNLSDTAEFDIEVFPKPVPDFSFAPVVPVENSPTVFTNLSSPDAVRFKWMFGDGDSLLTTSRAPVSHQFNATGSFNVCLTAYNAADCDSTICREVQALVVPVVGVPNAFTPNSGDANSIVKVEGFGIGKMTFIIWNRWGQKVFETNNRFQGWDGKVRGVVQPMDVYAYTLNVEFTDGTKRSLKGDITLIR